MSRDYAALAAMGCHYVPGGPSDWPTDYLLYVYWTNVDQFNEFLERYSLKEVLEIFRGVDLRTDGALTDELKRRGIHFHIRWYLRMRRRKYRRWHPSQKENTESLNRYTMERIHEHALKVNARIGLRRSQS